MEGRAAAAGAGTILNALATGRGSAFAIDLDTRSTVRIDPDAETISGTIDGAPEADTALIEACVRAVLERFGGGEGASVRTESDVPMAAGLKSSSAAANATVLATCDALGVEVLDRTEHATDRSIGDSRRISRLDACRIGVEAAREAGVTVTGAFDDASASMLGGVTVTDNSRDELLAHDSFDRDVLVWTPPERAFSADADVDRCKRIETMAELVEELALDGRYPEAMTVNGLAFSAALEFSTEPAVDAMAHADGVSLSGTGPSVVAIGDDTALDRVREEWAAYPGTMLRTTTRTDGGRIVDRGD